MHIVLKRINIWLLNIYILNYSIHIICNYQVSYSERIICFNLLKQRKFVLVLQPRRNFICNKEKYI